MITGVSTRFASYAALVPLLEVENTYRPAALPIWGTYNGYGALGPVLSGPHANRFQAAFERLLGRDVIGVDWPRLLEEPPATMTLAGTCRILERALVHDERAVTCDGRVLSFALLNGDVAEELLLEVPADAWAPPRETGQCSDAEALALLASARERFADDHAVLRGLDRYEKELDIEE